MIRGIYTLLCCQSSKDKQLTNIEVNGLTSQIINQRLAQIERVFEVLHRNQLIANQAFAQRYLFENMREVTPSSVAQNLASLKTQASDISHTTKQHKALIKTFKAPKAVKPKQPVRIKKPSAIDKPVKNESFDDAGLALTTDNVRSLSFDLTLEPFRFSQLPSGHMLFYRQVWPQGERIIQGFLMEQQEFLTHYFGRPFKDYTLASFVSMVLYNNEELLGQFDAISQLEKAESAPLGNHVLYQHQLAPPFNDLSVTLTYGLLPSKDSEYFLIVFGVMLMVLISIGFLGLYQLLISQYKLVQRQQGFISSVSHELKTPITSIRMYSDMLTQDWVEQDRKGLYYQYISEEADRLSRLIDNVLTAAEISHHKLPMAIITLDMVAVEQLVRQKTELLFKQAGFTLNLVIEPIARNSLLSVDKDAFTQIILNLVDNAIKYSQGCEKTQVDVTVSASSPQSLDIKIRDYGLGVSTQDKDRIFSQFYRGGNELTRTSKGTGLGLALVKELVNLMQGKIKLYRHKQGSEFVVTLPAMPKTDE